MKKAFPVSKISKSRLKTRKKIFVAMSGGVDSSVSAALLKKAGHDVTGVFMDVWQPDFVECRRGDDKKDAMRAAAHIGIPFLTFDFENDYKRDVIDYMVAEYKAGRTPNPDVMCNKRIKFGVFLEKARAMGADMIATGHYARVREVKSQKSKVKNTLLAGVDTNKDQSYFLWTLTQEQLRFTMFPVGGYMKPEVRMLARKFGLPNAERQESQGLCFVGELDMKEFLKHYIREAPGDVLDGEGDVIGRHSGAAFFTLGERHGFIVTKKTPNDPPLYVIAKDMGRNTITVAPRIKEEKGLVSEAVFESVNWISKEAPRPGKAYEARTRYRQPLQEMALVCGETRCLAHFRVPQRAVSPGQSLVIYDKDECLGGGIILG